MKTSRLGKKRPLPALLLACCMAGSSLLPLWAGQVQAAEQETDTLRFVNYRDVRDLNPHLYAGEMYAQEMLYETLVDIGPDGYKPNPTYTAWAVAICIFIVIYGRMLEVYLTASIAPIPMATMMGKEFGGMGQNYLRSLLALAFQAFLIIVCVAIYAVLVQNIALEEDVSKAIWTCMGYTVLLCFTLFKTSSMARSIFAAH